MTLPELDSGITCSQTSLLPYWVVGEKELLGTGAGGGTISHCKSWLFAEPANNRIAQGIVNCFMFIPIFAVRADFY